MDFRKIIEELDRERVDVGARTAFSLFWGDGLTIAEISAALDQEPREVRDRLRRVEGVVRRFRARSATNAEPSERGETQATNGSDGTFEGRNAAPRTARSPSRLNAESSERGETQATNGSDGTFEGRNASPGTARSRSNALATI